MANVSSSNGLEKHPKLRFQGFSEAWQLLRIGDIYAERSERGAEDMELLSVTMNDGVKMRSDIEGKDNSSEDKSNYKIVHIGDMVYNSMRMWQGASGISPYNGIVSPAYTILKPRITISNGFFAALFKTERLINEFRKNSQGMTSDTWNLKYPQIETIKIHIPSVTEQEKISKFIALIDAKIAKQRTLVESLKKYKRGLLSAVFSRKISFGNYGEWYETTISECLDYEQPQKYIVENEQYNDSYSTPVLTANKAFILGYTNESKGIYSKGDVIIYDDFTMDMKYVTFPFKVKSSTIKMLTPRKGFDLYFVYALLQSLELQPEGHQRSYISKLEPMIVKVPCYEEQVKISHFLQKYDSHVHQEEELLTKLMQQKSALLQSLFI